MNNEQRKRIAVIQTALRNIEHSEEARELHDAATALENALDTFKTARESLAGSLDEYLSDLSDEQDEERDKFDNMPEGLQVGERGQAIEAAATALEEAHDSLESAIEKLRDGDTDPDDIADFFSDIDRVADELEAIE